MKRRPVNYSKSDSSDTPIPALPPRPDTSTIDSASITSYDSILQNAALPSRPISYIQTPKRLFRQGQAKNLPNLLDDPSLELDLKRTFTLKGFKRHSRGFTATDNASIESGKLTRDETANQIKLAFEELNTLRHRNKELELLVKGFDSQTDENIGAAVDNNTWKEVQVVFVDEKLSINILNTLGIATATKFDITTAGIDESVEIEQPIPKFGETSWTTKMDTKLSGKDSIISNVSDQLSSTNQIQTGENKGKGEKIVPEITIPLKIEIDDGVNDNFYGDMFSIMNSLEHGEFPIESQQDTGEKTAPTIYKIRGETEQINKLKIENAKILDDFDRFGFLNDKKMTSLHDKFAKQEIVYQRALKDKTATETSLIAKGKEILDINFKLNAALSKIDKSEKIVLAYREKYSKADTTLKKEAKLKEDLKEMQKRLSSLSEKTEKEKSTFLSTNKLLQKSIGKIESELDGQKRIYDGQKVAYLDRIKILEKDLEIFENSIFRKDKDFDGLKERLSRDLEIKDTDMQKMAQSLNAQIDDLKTKSFSEQSVRDASIQDALAQIRKLQAQKMESKIEYKAKIESLEGHNNRLQDTVRDAHADLSLIKNRYTEDIEVKETTIVNYKTQIAVAQETIQLLQINLQDFEVEKSSLTNKSKIEAEELGSRIDLLGRENRAFILQAKASESKYNHKIESLNQIMLKSQSSSSQYQVKIQELENIQMSISSENESLLSQAKLSQASLAMAKADLKVANIKSQESQDSINHANMELSNLISEREASINLLESNIIALESCISEQKMSIEQNKNDFRISVDSLRCEIEALTANAESKTSMLDEEVSNMRSALNESRSENEMISCKYRELHETFEAVKEHTGKEKSASSSKCQRLLIQVSEREKDLQLALIEVEELRQKITSENQKKISNAKNQSMRDLELANNLEIVDKENGNLHLSLNTALSLNDSAQSQILSLGEELEKSLIDNKALIENNAQALSELAKKDSSIAIMNSDVDTLYSHIKDLDKHCSQTVGLLTEMTLKYNKTEQNYADFMVLTIQSEIATCSSEEVILNEINNSIFDTIDLLQEDLVELSASNIKLRILSELSEDQISIERNKNFELTMKIVQAHSSKSRASCYVDLKDQLIQSFENDFTALELEEQESQRRLDMNLLDMNQCTKELLDSKNQVQALSMQLKESCENDELQKSQNITLEEIISQLHAADKSKQVILIDKERVRLDLSRDLDDIKVNLESKEIEITGLKNEAIKSKSEYIKFIDISESKLLACEKAHQIEIGDYVVKQESQLSIATSLHDDLASISTLHVEVSQRAVNLESDIVALQEKLTDRQTKSEQLIQNLENVKLSRDQIKNREIALVSELNANLNAKSQLEKKELEQQRLILQLTTHGKADAEANSLLDLKCRNLSSDLEAKNEMCSALSTELAQRKSSFDSTSECQVRELAQDKEKIDKLVQLIELNQKELSQEQEIGRLASQSSAQSLQLTVNEHKVKLDSLNIQIIDIKVAYSALQKSSEIESLQNKALLGDILEMKIDNDIKIADYEKLSKSLNTSNTKAEERILESDIACQKICLKLKAVESAYEEKEGNYERDSVTKNSIISKFEADIKDKELALDVSLESGRIASMELESLREDSQHKFQELKEQIRGLISKSEFDSDKSLKSMNDIILKSIEKDNIIHQAEENLKESIVAKNQESGKASNIISSHVKTIQAMENNMVEKNITCQHLESELFNLVQQHQNFQRDSAQSLEARAKELAKEAADQWRDDQTELQLALSEKNSTERELLREMDGYASLSRLKIKLEESLSTMNNEKENFNTQLSMLEQRGKLHSSEIKKIGDLNADLFGHLNTRQKIKHVAQLKEENLSLKEQNMSLGRERDRYKKKSSNFERECESFKALKGSRILSRVARNVQDSFVASKRGEAFARPDVYKENVSVNVGRGLGGAIRLCNTQVTYSKFEDVRDQIGFVPYTAAQRIQVAQSIRNMFSVCLVNKIYVNRQSKIDNYSIDPIPIADKLLAEAGRMNDMEFHYRYVDLFMSLRDFHTTYHMPGPHKCVTNYKAILFEIIGNSPNESIVVTRFQNDRIFDLSPEASNVSVGDELVSLSGIPIKTVLQNLVNLTGGANNAGSLRATLASLSRIDGNTNRLPISSSDLYEFKNSGGHLYQVNLPWISGIDSECWMQAKMVMIGIRAGKHVSLPPTMPIKTSSIAPKRSTKMLDSESKSTLDSIGKSFHETFEPSIIWAIHDRGKRRLGIISIQSFEPLNCDVHHAVRLIRHILLNNLADTSALLIDVRSNLGGLIPMADLLPQLFAGDIKTESFRSVVHDINERLFLNRYWDKWNRGYEEIEIADRFTPNIKFTENIDANLIGQAYNKPVGIFTNGACYSSCEIFAATMKDNQKAIIFGEDTQTGGGGANDVNYNYFLSLELPKYFPAVPYLNEMPLAAQNFNIAWKQVIRIDGSLIEDRGVLSDHIIRPSSNDILASGDFDSQYDKIADILFLDGDESGQSSQEFRLYPYEHQDLQIGENLVFEIFSSGFSQIQVTDIDGKSIYFADIKPYHSLFQTIVKIGTQNYNNRIDRFCIKGYNLNGIVTFKTWRTVRFTPKLDQYLAIDGFGKLDIVNNLSYIGWYDYSSRIESSWARYKNSISIIGFALDIETSVSYFLNLTTPRAIEVKGSYSISAIHDDFSIGYIKDGSTTYLLDLASTLFVTSNILSHIFELPAGFIDFFILFKGGDTSRSGAFIESISVIK